MQIQTFSAVTPEACNASCPWCVASMTGNPSGKTPINEWAFHKAAQLAKTAGTTTVLITGKGEPLLFPDMVTRYLELCQQHQFPFLELQTNALDIGWLARDGAARSMKRINRDLLARWHDELGLNTVAISAVHYRSDRNARNYCQKQQDPTDYPSLDRTVEFLHGLGYTVRLCIMMQRGDIDTPERVEEVVRFCREQGIEQLKLSPIRRPKYYAHDNQALEAAATLGITAKEISRISKWVRQNGHRQQLLGTCREVLSQRVPRGNMVARMLQTALSAIESLERSCDVDHTPHQLLMRLMHGAEVFDIGGQNVCLADCLTLDPTRSDIRTLIYYWDGRIAYDWQFPGAVLLGGTKPKELDVTDTIVQLGGLRASS